MVTIMGWQEESRVRPLFHTVPPREIQAQEEAGNTCFLQRSVENLRGFQISPIQQCPGFGGF